MSDLTIGAAMQALGSEYSGGILGGIERAARERDARLLVFRGTPGDVAAAPFAREVRGWIAVHSPSGLPALARLGLPLVTVPYQEPEVGCSAVLADNFHGVRDAVRHLIAHGHRRIAFIGLLEYPAITERYEGYRDALRESGLPCFSELIIGVEDNHVVSARAGARRLLEGGALPCTAVVAGTDLNAAGVMEVLQGAGLRVPEDVAVVGFDDERVAQLTDPPLTTLRTRVDEFGWRAANLLLDEISGIMVPRTVHRVPVALIRRRSCGCDMAETLPSPPGAEGFAACENDALAAHLVRTALFPSEPDRVPAEIWPGVETLIGGLDAALAGDPEPTTAALRQAWRQAVQLTLGVDVLRAMTTFLSRAGVHRLAAMPPDPDRAHRLEAFVARSELELWRARVAYGYEEITQLEELTRNSLKVAMLLVSGPASQAQALDWLDLTPVRWGCLALYDDARRAPTSTLSVAGTYRRSGPPLPTPGTQFVAGAFPPAEWCSAPGSAVGTDVLVLVPVASGSRDWGVLALRGPIEVQGTHGPRRPSHMAMWGPMLAAVLERDAVEAKLAQLADENRKRAEQALRRSEATVVEAQRVGHIGSWVWDRASGTTSWSAEMFRLFDLDPRHGQPSPELIDQRLHPDDRERVHSVRASAIREKVDLEHEYRILLPDGTVRHVQATCHPVLDGAGDVVEVVGTARDVTERKQAEHALREAQVALAHVTRVTTLGEVTASIAHEVNQPLAAIAVNAAACLNMLTSGAQGVEPVRGILADIAEDAQRAADIIARIRQLARRSAPERVEVRPIDVVSNVLALAAAECAARRTTIRADVPAELPVVFGDRVQLQQVLLNLMVNGMEAMADVDDAERRLEIHARLETGDGPPMVTISVADRGTGLPPGETHRLFDPFYTSKPHGMGLGLAISRSIIEAHGGRLWAASNGERGAIFSFQLPAASTSTGKSAIHART